MLRSYIESNPGFMREHRNYMVAIAEIVRSGPTADGQQRVFGHPHADEFAGALEDLLSSFQATGDLRSDFNPHFMAITIRAAIGAVPRRLVQNPGFNIDDYAGRIADLFNLATRLHN